MFKYLEMTTLTGAAMSSVGWAILLVGLALAADVAWAEYRARYGRRWSGLPLIRARQAKHVFREVSQDQIR